METKMRLLILQRQDFWGGNENICLWQCYGRFCCQTFQKSVQVWTRISKSNVEVTSGHFGQDRFRLEQISGHLGEGWI